MTIAKAITSIAKIGSKEKIKLLGFLSDAKSSLQKFKPDLTDKASKQDLKFSREAKSEAQSGVEQGYDLKIPKNIDRSLGSISSEIQKGNKDTAISEIEALMRELGE
mgnify:CR=1 FL=1